MSNPAPGITQCTNCNGDLTFNPGNQTLDCQFCNTTFTMNGEVIKSEATINEAPQLIIPFAFSKDVFNKSALEWLSAGDFTPVDVLEGFNNNATKGIYIPAYLFEVSYVITSGPGSQVGNTEVVLLAEVRKKWPSELEDLAKASVSGSGDARTFDKAYTLGFEVEEEITVDVNSFNKKAKELCIKDIAENNELLNSENIVVNQMAVTKIYAPFWINTYQYKDRNYEVIMSGADPSQIGGTRPVDIVASKVTMPTYKPTAGLLVVCFILSIVSGISGSQPLDPNSFKGKLADFCGILLFAVPILFVVTYIRRKAWTSPVEKLQKAREQKLSQRLAQRV